MGGPSDDSATTDIDTLAMFPLSNITQVMSVTVQVEQSGSYEFTDLFPAGEAIGCFGSTPERLHPITTLRLSSRLQGYC